MRVSFFLGFAGDGDVVEGGPPEHLHGEWLDVCGYLEVQAAKSNVSLQGIAPYSGMLPVLASRC